MLAGTFTHKYTHTHAHRHTHTAVSNRHVLSWAGICGVRDVMRVAGTMQYMSPERLNGNGAGYSWPADVWSAGLIMLECAMGQHPYQAMGEAVPFFFPKP